MAKILLSGAMAFAAIIAAPVAAQPAGSRQTREFVDAAGQSDQFEMLEAHTVLAQSTDPQVRAFAQHMLEDHDRTSRDLGQATAQSGLQPPPMALGGDQAKMLSALQSLNGPDFDHAYIRQQALAHRSTLVVERQYAAGGDDPAVRRAAVAAVPVVAAHLDMAERMLAASGGS